MAGTAFAAPNKGKNSIIVTCRHYLSLAFSKMSYKLFNFKFSALENCRTVPY